MIKYKIPQTAEEHVNIIMERYLETKSLRRCFDPKIGEICKREAATVGAGCYGLSARTIP